MILSNECCALSRQKEKGTYFVANDKWTPKRCVIGYFVNSLSVYSE